MSATSRLPFTVVTGPTVRQFILDDLPGCVEVVAAAYRAHDEGRTVSPSSFFLRPRDRPDARIIALPRTWTSLAGVWNQVDRQLSRESPKASRVRRPSWFSTTPSAAFRSPASKLR